MRWLKRVLIFIVSFLIYHLAFGCNVFPVDENNVLQAPAWYPLLGIALSIAATLILGNLGLISRKINEWANYRDPLGERKHISDQKVDALYEKAISIVLEQNNASMSLLQRKLDISFGNAKGLIDKMERDGIISPSDGKTPRKILIKNERRDTSYAPASPSNRFGGTRERFVKKITSGYTPTQNDERRQPLQAAFSFNAELKKIDEMDGHAFEFWCASLLKKIGFQNVKVTQGSGDQGVDILAVKDGIKYAIQCKCYSSDLGNKPIQEINTGKVIYQCQVGAVITNRYFTAGGKKAAEATGVLLWDRNWIQAALESTKTLEGAYS